MWLLGRISYYIILIAITFILVRDYILYSLFHEPLKTSLNYDLVNIIKSDGYNCEKHVVVTEDGYIIDIFRVRASGVKAWKPVLLMHGVLQNGAAWIDAGPGDSLAYLLADEGHDVWLGTVRGTRYARQHINLKPTDPAFWLFTHDDMAQYDLPALIDYITKNTGFNSINYIGFSQGSMIAFMLLSERPDYARKLDAIVALAPGSRFKSSKSRAAKAITYTAMFLKNIGVGSGGLEVVGDYSLIKKVQEYFCCGGYTKICSSILAALDAPNPGSLSERVLKTLFVNYPDGTSLDNLVKFGLIVKSGRFHKTDYGKEGNIKQYGAEHPPDYNMRNVATETLIINGRNDHIVDPDDSVWLNSQLRNSKIKFVEDPLWNHVDMTYSQNIKTLLLPDVLDFLNSSTKITKNY